jgi:hypothetical protein
MNTLFGTFVLRPGMQVRLKSDPEGQPGTIERIVAGKAVVRWNGYISRHPFDKLVITASAPQR